MASPTRPQKPLYEDISLNQKRLRKILMTENKPDAIVIFCHSIHSIEKWSSPEEGPIFIFIIGKSFDKLADYRQTFQDLYAMRRLVRDFFRQFIAGRQSIFCVLRLSKLPH